MANDFEIAFPLNDRSAGRDFDEFSMELSAEMHGSIMSRIPKSIVWTVVSSEAPASDSYLSTATLQVCERCQ